MNILIPTYGRVERQETLRQLLAAGLNPILVVQERELDLYAEHHGGDVVIMALPDTIRTIAPTRQYILDVLAEDRFCMVDDDLYFYARRKDDRTKLREITPLELHAAFDDMDNVLKAYSHAGFAAREGANRNTHEFMENTRIMRVLGYNRGALNEHGIRFDQMEVMEDFHVALSLLERGLPNLVLNNYAHNQAGGSGDSGGCSHFRTPELQARNAQLLADLHPGFVKVTKKTTKGAWGGMLAQDAALYGASHKIAVTRTDVTVYWKKAYDAARRKAVADQGSVQGLDFQDR